MNWRFIHHNEISYEDVIRIASIKDQHWNYGIKSQIEWMNNNVDVIDVHLLGEKYADSVVSLIAYCTLVNLVVFIDNQKYDFIGVGGVCVDKNCQHLGIGQQLMDEVRKYISQTTKFGILLCKDQLIPFYEKCGWKLLRYKTTTIANINYNNNIMVLSNPLFCSDIRIDKNF